MADTYTTASKARLIQDATRSGTWGPVLNADALELIDDMASGIETINLGASTSYAMAALGNGTDSESRAAYLKFTGTPASAVTVTVPASVVNKKYIVDNQSGQRLTIKYASGTGVALGNLDKCFVWCDGSEVYDQGPGYRITAAEIAAGETPVNYFLTEGTINRYGTNATPGTTDMTAACQSAYNVCKNGKGIVQGLAQTYLVTGIAFDVVDNFFVFRGVPNATIFLNKASANKPTFNINGGQFFDIRGCVCIGAATFPNYGFDLTNFWAFGIIKTIVCQTNSWGVHMDTGNTLTIEDYEYWPSGGSGFGGTADANNIKGMILADGAAAVNSIYLTNLNGSNQTTIANGGCVIRADGSASPGFQDWKIDGLNAENGPVATHRAIWASKAQSWVLRNIFTENSQVLFDQRSESCDVTIQAGSSGTLQLDGSGAANIRMHIHDCVGLSFTADSANDGTIQINNSWQVAPGDADSSINKIRINTFTTGGVREPDIILVPWITPTFAAGDYTANTGTWVVASGDVTNCQYKIRDGKTMVYTQAIDTTTTTGGPANLRRVIPGGFTAAKSQWYDMIYSLDNGTTTSRGLVRTLVGDTKLYFYRDLNSTAFTNVTDLLLIYCNIEFEIQ